MTSGQVLKPEAITRVGGVLARLYQSLAEFTELTDHLRRAVDGRLARHLQVTGWSDGILRVHLDQPALATRWRFQEPMVRRQLGRLPGMRDLREIRLSLTPLPGRSAPAGQPGRLDGVPVDAVRDLAGSESHPALRRALEELAAAAEAARRQPPA